MIRLSTSSHSIRRTVGHSATCLLLLGTLSANCVSLRARPRVQVNNRELTTSVAPIQRNNRTLVPMRAIFQALGATLNWNRFTREITGQFGAANVRLQIGQRDALVNGRRVRLDQPPILYRGSTMVPLRFVAEGLGADVHWNDALELASINTRGTAGQPQQANSGAPTITIPADAVVAVRLSDTLSSAQARVGDVFNASVQSQQNGDAEFPRGTILQGVIRQVQRRTRNAPGVMDVEFRFAVLPDGTRYPIRGALIPLTDNAVQDTVQGRRTARPIATRGDRLQIVGIGTGGVGYVLGRVQRRNGRVTGVSGVAGRSLYSGNRNRFVEAVIPQGTTFGVRMINSVSYGDTGNYATQRGDFLDGVR